LFLTGRKINLSLERETERLDCVRRFFPYAKGIGQNTRGTGGEWLYQPTKGDWGKKKAQRRLPGGIFSSSDMLGVLVWA